METPEHIFQRCPHCESDQNLITTRFCGMCGQDLGRTCVRCGTNNFSGTDHCAACGAELPLDCPKCHALNLPEYQFCGTCGFPLIGDEDVEALTESELPVRRERRKVSVLFVDIRGFTELSNRMDTEEIYFLIDQALRRLASEVRRYGGSVDKFTGDGLMALFGAPEPLEQHALRAVGAAMSMQRVMQTYGEESQARHNLDLRIRIGINSGEVVAGEVGADHFRAYTVIGDTVNLASRLEEAARPGHILVSDSVYRATNGSIEYMPAEPLHLKGYEAPIQAYEVLRLKQQPGSSRGVPGLESPLIGRTQEMQMLCSLVPALEAGKGGAAFIVADAGTGKSRLLTEFIEEVTENQLHMRCITGICSDHTRGFPYSLFTDLFTRYLELPFGQRPEQTRKQISKKLRDMLPEMWEELRPFVNHLLSIGATKTDDTADVLRNLSPEQVKQQIFRAVRTILRAEAKNTPLLIVLEDLHWMDDLSHELLQSLLYFIDDVPILICATSRPDGAARVQALSDLAGRICPETNVFIDLPPLTDEHTEALLSQLLDNPTLPAQLQQDIVDYAEGLPLYLEELLRALIDADVIINAKDGWKATTDQSLDSIDVSQTLNEIVMARYSSLPLPLRNIVALAAVIGRYVPYKLLDASIGQSTSPPLLLQLERLEESRLIRRRESSPHLEYAFENLITQRTIYDSLFSTDRQKLHLQVGYALEELSSETDERVELLAYHFQRSTEEERALSYLIRAGEKAAGRYANKEAVQFFQQAKEIAPTAGVTDEQMITIEMGLGDVLSLTGEYDAARNAYTRALTFTQAQGDHGSPVIAALFRSLASTHLRQGNYDKALDILKTSLEKLDTKRSDTASSAEAARIYSEIGWVHFRYGELQEAHRWLAEARSLARDDDAVNDSISAGILNRLGGVAFQRGEFEEAITHTRSALRIRERLGQHNEIARTSANLAVLQSKRGAWNDATDLYNQVCTSYEQIGDLEGLSLALVNLGTLHTFMGNYEAAYKTLTRSREIAEKLSSPFLSAMAEQAHARLHLGQKDLVAAQHALEHSTQLAVNANLPPGFRIINLSLLGEVYAREQAIASLATTVERAQTIVTEHDSIGSDIAFYHRLNGMYARLRGEWEKACEELLQSHRLFADDPFEQARTAVELALTARARDKYREYETYMADAEDIFAELGADGELDRIEHLNATAYAS